MKDLSIAKLNDVYGKLLTDKQADIIEQYYEFDYSLSEIAENLSITRQAVHYALKLGVKKLKDCEKKLSMCKKISDAEQILKLGLDQDSPEQIKQQIMQALKIL